MNVLIKHLLLFFKNCPIFSNATANLTNVNMTTYDTSIINSCYCTFPVTRDIEGKLWFGVGWNESKFLVKCLKSLGKLKSVYYQSYFCFLQIFC